MKNVMMKGVFPKKEKKLSELYEFPEGQEENYLSLCLKGREGVLQQGPAALNLTFGDCLGATS